MTCPTTICQYTSSKMLMAFVKRFRDAVSAERAVEEALRKTYWGRSQMTLLSCATAICIELIQQYLALYRNWVGFLWNIEYIFQNHSL